MAQKLPYQACLPSGDLGSTVMGVTSMFMAMSALILAIAASDAAAQQMPASPTPPQPTAQGTSATPQAPIGHPQPRLGDLPADLARRQQSGGQSKPGEPTSAPLV